MTVADACHQQLGGAPPQTPPSPGGRDALVSHGLRPIRPPHTLPIAWGATSRVQPLGHSKSVPSPAGVLAMLGEGRLRVAPRAGWTRPAACQRLGQLLRKR
jgi:hypothetical protein